MHCTDDEKLLWDTSNPTSSSHRTYRQTSVHRVSKQSSRLHDLFFQHILLYNLDFLFLEQMDYKQ